MLKQLTNNGIGELQVGMLNENTIKQNGSR